MIDNIQVFTMKKLLFLLSITLSVLQLQGQSAETFIIQGDNFLMNTQFENAINAYTRALEVNPDHVEALIKRSQAYATTNRLGESTRDMEKALEINPYARLMLHPNQRMDAIATKKYDYKNNVPSSAVGFQKSFIIDELYLDVLMSDINIPDMDREALTDALTAIVNRDFDDARSYLQPLSGKATECALYNDLMGLIELEEGDIDTAIIYFSNAIAANPDFILPYHNRAIAFKLQGQYTLALKDLKQALSLDNSVPMLHFALGQVKARTGQKEAANEAYGIASKKAKYYPEALANQATVQKAMGNFTEAMIFINEAIDQDATQIENYFIRGGISFIYGDYQLAIDDFNKYLTVYPTDSEALFNRALSYILNRQEDFGCVDLKRAVELGYTGENTDAVLHLCN